MIFELVCVFILGLCFGSFSNVIIHRLPLDESIVTPRSRCPHCKAFIRWYENIPVFSWLLLKGCCSHCKKGIGLRYPFVELLMASLFMTVYSYFGLSWTCLEFLILSFGLVTITFIDLDHRIIPDVFSLTGIVLGLLGAALNPEREFLDALYGVLMGGGFFWAVAYVYLVIRKEEGLGGGDIKLLAWLGAYMGWKSIPFIILGSSLLGTAFGLAMIFKGGNLKSSLPFGPFIVIAAYLYLFAGQEIMNLYFSLFFPWMS